MSDFCNKPGCTADPKQKFGPGLKRQHTHSENGLVFLEWEDEVPWPTSSDLDIPKNDSQVEK